MEDPQLLEENAREHRAIREALDRRSREDARRLMTAHVQRSGELVARWFERQAQAG
jgi:DNA-binding GntR family transcriptional regulator